MSRTYVIGVGMTKFDKPGTKEGDYPDWAKEAGEKALADAGIPYERRRAGLRRLLLRRLDLRAARALRARPHRHPGRQRQQQLLDRLLGAVPRPPGGPGRPRRLRARARLREDGEGLARDEVHRPHPGARQAHGRDVRGPRARGVAVRAADVRQRRPRAHGEVRLEARALRLDRLEEPQALGQQPLRPVPGRVLARRDQGRADDPRAADEAAVLADLRRRRRARSSRPRASSTSTASGTRRSRSPARRWSPTSRSTFDEDADCIKIVGYDMSKEAAAPGLRGGGHQRRRRRRLRAPRLLQRQRADHLRGARLRRRGRGAQAGRGRGDDLRRRRPGRQPLRRADLARATRSARPASRSARELTWQLRGTADERQVDGAKVALQHNIGLGGAAVVSVYKPARRPTRTRPDGRKRQR